MFSRTYLKLFIRTNIRYINVKYRHRDTHWSVQVKKKTAVGRTLEHFDDFYKSVYEKSWNSIRHGLLANHKYVAIVNNFSDSEKTIASLESNGAINMRALFNLEKERIIKQYEQEQLKRQNDAEKIQISNSLNTGNGVLYATTEMLLSTQKTDLKVSSASSVADTLKMDKTETLSEEQKANETISSSISAEENMKSLEADKIGALKEKKNSTVNSVEESLKYAQIDTSRIINPDTSDPSLILCEFIPATKLKGKEDWIPETQHYKYYEVTEAASSAVKVEKEYDIHFPEYLNVYCYERSNHSAFEEPRKGVTDVYDYYLLDGASILPILVLGLKPGDKFLDMCCAPGGKTLIALQTLYPERVVCNDIDLSRVKRIRNVLRQYLYDLEDRWFATNRLKVTQEDGRTFLGENFDRILVDVPCTNDRLSVRENDNNWFKPSRTKERLQLPEVQAALLANALKLVKVGGTVVYSTCSLSPIQNDGVVSMALKQIWEETSLEIIVKDLSLALEMTQCVFKYAEKNLLRYGHLVVPYLPQNYGPMYFCKLERTR